MFRTTIGWAQMVAAFFLFCGFASRQDSAPKTAGPLTVEDTINTRSFGEVSPVGFSSDGRSIAYMIRDRRGNERPQQFEELETYARSGVSVPNLGGDIWLSDSKTGETRNLTGGVGNNWDPSWSPDGRYLAFLSDRDKERQAHVWLWDSAQDTLRQLATVPVRANYEVNELLWTPDSRKVLITTVPEGMAIEEYVQRVYRPTSDSRENAWRQPGSTVSIYKVEGIAEAAKKKEQSTFDLDLFFLHDLAMIDISTGSVRYITHNRRIEKYALSADGRHLTYAIPKNFDAPGSYRRVYDLATIDLVTMEEWMVASDVPVSYRFNWSPDGSVLCYVLSGQDHRSKDVYVVGAGERTGRKVATIAPREGEPLDEGAPPEWDATGQHVHLVLSGVLWRVSVSMSPTVETVSIPSRRITHILSIGNRGIWSEEGEPSADVIVHNSDSNSDAFLKVHFATGRSDTLLDEGKCYTCKWVSAMDSRYLLAIATDGRRVAYTVEDASHPTDVWIADVDFKNRRQLTDINPQFSNYKMGQARLVDWLSDDGKPLRGALLLPTDYREGKKYPLIVWVYPGGMLSVQFDRFGFDMDPLNAQLFATRGFAVLLPDSEEEVGDRMGGLLKSVMPGVSRIVQMGIADPERIALMGHSQGGFAVLALLVQTNRFKTAVATDGWGDFTALYGAMDRGGGGYQLGQAERQLGGPPWQYPMRYFQNSPANYLDRIKTPLLLVHASADVSIPVFLADEVFVSMRRLGKQVEYARYEGESHAPRNWSYPNQLDFTSRVIAWLNSQLN